MKTNQCDIGLIGLAVMGENLGLNMESKGFQVAVFNRTTAVTEKFAAGRGQGKNIQPTTTMEEFVSALQRPRKAMIMVKAGAPVDSVISQLVPLLEKGDVVIDGGNSLFTDTQRRCRELEGRGIHFVGCGVSGGTCVSWSGGWIGCLLECANEGPLPRLHRQQRRRCACPCGDPCYRPATFGEASARAWRNW